jgi:hypothetical protein
MQEKTGRAVEQLKCALGDRLFRTLIEPRHHDKVHLLAEALEDGDIPIETEEMPTEFAIGERIYETIPFLDGDYEAETQRAINGGFLQFPALKQLAIEAGYDHLRGYWEFDYVQFQQREIPRVFRNKVTFVLVSEDSVRILYWNHGWWRAVDLTSDHYINFAWYGGRPPEAQIVLLQRKQV